MKTVLSVINNEASPHKTESLSVQDCVAVVLTQPAFPIAATTLASTLAHALGADHVCIGLLKGPAMRLVAWSDTADVREELGVVRLVTAAMEEAADQHCSLRYPLPPEDPPRITLMHAELSGQGFGGALLTIPLSDRQQVTGALTLARKRPWSGEERDRLENLAGAIGPALRLRQRADESLPAHLRRSLRDFVARLRGPGALGTKLATLCAALLAAFALLVPVADTVKAPARLEGVIQRSITAPADSFIQDVLTRPGAQVKTGQVLLTLKDTDLRNEHLRLEGELARFRGEQAEAFARQDRAQMVIAQAKVEEVSAQLALVADQLARTRLVAPFDGIIIRGDLQQHAGAPVKRGDVLMVLAPAADYRLALQVDEREVARLLPGHLGEVAFAALPGERFPIRVERITPVASLKEGRNSFEVEASLQRRAAGLRPGLEGFAHIQEGRRPLGLIWARRVLDWASFKLWTWFG